MSYQNMSYSRSSSPMSHKHLHESAVNTLPVDREHAEYLINREGMEDTRFDLVLLQKMVSTGLLTTNDFVWTEGMKEWQPLGTMLRTKSSQLHDLKQQHLPTSDTSASHTAPVSGPDHFAQSRLDHLPASHLPIIKVPTPDKLLAAQASIPTPPGLPRYSSTQQTPLHLVPPPTSPHYSSPAHSLSRRSGLSAPWLISLLVAGSLLILALVGVAGLVWYVKRSPQSHQQAFAGSIQEISQQLPKAQLDKPESGNSHNSAAHDDSSFTAWINTAKNNLDTGAVQVLNTTEMDYYRDSNMLVSFPLDWFHLAQEGSDGDLPFYFVSAKTTKDNVVVMRYSNKPAAMSESQQKQYLESKAFHNFLSQSYKGVEISSTTPTQVDGKPAVALEWKFTDPSGLPHLAYSIFFTHNGYLFALQLNIPQDTLLETHLTKLRSQAVSVIDQISNGIVLLK